MNKSPDNAGRLSQKLKLLDCILNEEGIAAASNRGIPPRPDPRDFPLSFAQKRLWLLDRLEPGPHYNDHFNLRLRGPLDVPALQNSLDEIVRRHEALRATFSVSNGEPIQTILPPFSVSLPFTDLSSSSPAERLDSANQIAVEAARTPIDLQHGPLLRAKLLRLDRHEHILVLIIHHIAIDGWSRAVLLRELTTLYQSFNAGLPSPLPMPKIQYADFAAWQQQWIRDEVLPAQLAYWKQQLAGAPALLELPASHPRPQTQSFRGARQSISIPKHLADSLTALSRREGCTLFMTLLAAFQTLASRCTGSKDIVIGSPIANRNRSEIEDLIGWFANTLVLRTDLSGNPSFREAMSRARETALAAYAHQDLPYEKLVEELRPARSPGYNPVFQLMFVFQNTPTPILKTAALDLSPFDIDSGISKFDLLLNLEESPDGITGWIEYATDLFDAGAIIRLAGHYQTLLEGIAANPNRPISTLPIITPEERRQILVEWNSTAVDYPKNACVHALFEEQAAKTPDSIALICGAERLTYGDLNARANQLAHHLRDCGVGPNIPVCISVERSLEMMVGVLGILKAGGAYVPIDPAYPQERVAYMLQDSKAPILLTQASLVERAIGTNLRILCLDRDWEIVSRASRENPVLTAGPQSLVYLIYTSGSTGRPKAAGVYHRGFTNLLHWWVTEYAVTSDDRTLMIGSLSFDLIQKGMYGPLIRGGELHIFPPGPYDPAAIAQSIEDNQITLINCSPATFYPVVDAAAANGFKQLMSLQRITVGGEALSLARMKPLLANENCRTDIANHYGPTECSDISAAYLLTRANMNNYDYVPIGRPIYNAQLTIVNEDLQLCPIGVAGELLIGGDGVGAGYLNNPGMTAAKFIANPFPQTYGSRVYRTGDLCRYLPDGNIQFLGRMDHQVKIRGCRIELSEIESALVKHDAIREVSVIVRNPDPGITAEPAIVAYFAPKNGVTPEASELRRFLREKLPDYMVPSAFVALEKFPLSPNGKVDRRALPAPAQKRADAGPQHTAPRNAIEKTLGEIWSSVLHLDQVGVNDNFFDLGGHSLLMVQLHARICEALKTDLSIIKLFQYPNIRAMADFLGQSSAANPTLQKARDLASRQRQALNRLRPAERVQTP